MVFYLYFSKIFTEHGGHHGHSHGITRSNNKLAQLANTDDNENNSFMYSTEVNRIIMQTIVVAIVWNKHFFYWNFVLTFYVFSFNRFKSNRKKQICTHIHTIQHI